MRSTDQALQTARSRQDLVRMKSRCSSKGDMNSLGYSKDAFGQSIAIRKLCVLVMQDFAQQGIKLLYYRMNCLSLQQLDSFPRFERSVVTILTHQNIGFCLRNWKLGCNLL